MNFDELYAYLENFTLGKLREGANVLIEFSDKTWLCAKNYYPDVIFGIYSAIDELGGIPDAKILEFSPKVPVNGDNLNSALEEVCQKIMDYITNNNLTYIFLADEFKDEELEESVKDDSVSTVNFNRLYEETINDISNSGKPWEKTYKYYIVRNVKVNDGQQKTLIVFGSDDLDACKNYSQWKNGDKITLGKNLLYFNWDVNSPDSWFDPEKDYSEELTTCVYCGKELAEGEKTTCDDCAEKLKEEYSDKHPGGHWTGD